MFVYYDKSKFFFFIIQTSDGFSNKNDTPQYFVVLIQGCIAQLYEKMVVLQLAKWSN